MMGLLFVIGIFLWVVFGIQFIFKSIFGLLPKTLDEICFSLGYTQRQYESGDNLDCIRKVREALEKEKERVQNFSSSDSNNSAIAEVCSLLIHNYELEQKYKFAEEFNSKILSYR